MGQRPLTSVIKEYPRYSANLDGMEFMIIPPLPTPGFLCRLSFFSTLPELADKVYCCHKEKYGAYTDQWRRNLDVIR